LTAFTKQRHICSNVTDTPLNRFTVSSALNYRTKYENVRRRSARRT